MFPYINIAGNKIYMTGIWIIIMFICFITIVFYLTKKYKQDFRKFFYWLPILITLTYLLGTYADFVLNVWLIPHGEERLMLLTPYWYKFHFLWILIGFVIALRIFFKKIQRYESKKLRIDIFFYGISLSLVPLGFFLLLWDDFIGNPSTGSLAVKRLIEDSELRKFSSVYPIGMFISVGSLIITILVTIFKKQKKKFWFGILGFAWLLIVINLVFLFQQYPRHWIISVGNFALDIKQHISFIIIMFCLYLYNKRKRYT